MLTKEQLNFNLKYIADCGMRPNWEAVKIAHVFIVRKHITDLRAFAMLKPGRVQDACLDAAQRIETELNSAMR